VAVFGDLAFAGRARLKRCATRIRDDPRGVVQEGVRCVAKLMVAPSSSSFSFPLLGGMVGGRRPAAAWTAMMEDSQQTWEASAG
jgi:hypothetical protein